MSGQGEWRLTWRRLRATRSDFVKALRDRPSACEAAAAGDPAGAVALSALARRARRAADDRRAVVLIPRRAPVSLPLIILEGSPTKETPNAEARRELLEGVVGRALKPGSTVESVLDEQRERYTPPRKIHRWENGLPGEAVCSRCGMRSRTIFDRVNLKTPTHGDYKAPGGDWVESVTVPPCPQGRDDSTALDPAADPR